MRFIKIADLEPGMVLARPVVDIKGHMMLAQNVKLNTYTIMKLNSFDFKGVYIFDEISDGIDIIESIPLSLRLQTIQATKDLNIDSCIILGGQIVDAVRENEFIETNMSNLCIFDNDTYNHCVNVAMYCARTGITMGLSEEELKKLATAALLHDIGKTRIPIEILNKPGPLTPEERSIINTHPFIGYSMVKDDPTLSAVSKVGIYEHHENVDGSGYPRALTGEEIHIVSKIIHVCDVYDALISRRSYKDKINPTDVIEYLYGGCGSMFDVKVVMAFISRLLPYPKGVVLNMSNNRQAIVMDNHDAYPTRPIIRMLDTREEIDLMEQLDLTIVGFDDI